MCVNDSERVNKRWLIDDLIDKQFITKVARNQYIKTELNNFDAKMIYKPHLSDKASNLINVVESEFPLVDFIVWDLNILNEFVNHLIARNIILLDVEKSARNYVYMVLQNAYRGDILLDPTLKEIDYYLHGDIIVVGNLVSEAPKNILYPHELTIEKLIVDLFANKFLHSILSQGDYPEAISLMNENYIIDKKTLYRYARRRNYYDKVNKFMNMCIEYEEL